MKKITDFIVDKKNIILPFFIIMTIICLFLSGQVKVNYDMTSYLPSDSETRIGMNIMDDEFVKETTSSFNIMFEGLTTDEKENIYQELSKIKNVSSVEYDKESADYNKDDYTLYIVNVAAKDDSKQAKKVYQTVLDKYQDYEIATSGNIASCNEKVLPTWIMVVAISICAAILIIMCQSYVEPFLFLLTIGIAIVLNNGTNVIFKNVSNITVSIAAILQLALSMDYSIMLMNRYRQEKEKCSDKVKAMKEALYKAFKAISSSSVTTIVGLLALVFMSFTIGRDLGLVLAKGVLLSLISIFLVLPGLILIFDKLIIKTKKKAPNFNLTKLGNFSYRFRYVALFILVFLFVVSYLLKGNLKILYTASEMDAIADVFKENNQMAIIYENKDEEKVSKYCQEMENENQVDKVICYGNTLNQKFTYNELNNKIKDLGSKVDIEDYLLKIIYYNYYNQNKENRISFNQFVNFIQNEVYNNTELNSHFNQESKQSIKQLSYFTDIDSINQKRNLNELADILKIDNESIQLLLTYYQSKNTNTKLDMPTLIKFINNQVLTNPVYASRISTSQKQSIKQLEIYTNKNNLQKNMTSKEMSKFLGINNDLVEQLYLYYYIQNGVDLNLSLQEFSQFMLNDFLKNPNYADSINEELKNQIKVLNVFSQVNLIKKDMTIEELARLFGLDENIIKQLMLFKYQTQDNGTKMTLGEFVNTVAYLKANTPYLNDVDVSSILSLKDDQTIMNNPNQYTASEVATILNVGSERIMSLYALIDLVNNNTSTWRMSPYQAVNIILENKNNPSFSSLDEETLKQIILLKGIMDSAIDNTKYSYSQLANFLNVDSKAIKQIYVLYASKNNDLKLKPLTLVNFIIASKDDSVFSGQLNKQTLNNLYLLRTIMQSTINNTLYDYESLAQLLSMKTDDTKLIYALYDIEEKNVSIELSLSEFTNFVLDDVLTNPDFVTYFDDDSIKKLRTINGIMQATINDTKYLPGEIYQILTNLTDAIDENTVELLYIYYGSSYNYNSKWTLTIEQLINYLNDDILNDERFEDFIDVDMENNLKEAKYMIDSNKKQLVGEKYSRIIINTTFLKEAKDTFKFIENIKQNFENDNIKAYIIGDSPMAYEMSNTFDNELNSITILTMIVIFIVVEITFKSLFIPLILVLIIQTAVYITMGILSLLGGQVYFIALLIVQSILMGATIDYAILYTSYYKELRNTLDVKTALGQAYNKSIHTILTSASILIVVTFIVGMFASAIAAKICKTLCQGTLCSALLILLILPSILAASDKIICRKKNK